MPLISNCSMMPAWHQLVSMSGHVEELKTARKLQLYATSIYQVHSFVCQLDYKHIGCFHKGLSKGEPAKKWGEGTTMFSTVQSPYSKSVVHAIQCMKEATVTILPLLIARLHSNHYINQWRNMWGGQGVKCPQRLLTGKFLLTYQEKRGKEKKRKRGENWKEKKKNCKREGGKLKM